MVLSISLPGRFPGRLPLLALLLVSALPRPAIAAAPVAVKSGGGLESAWVLPSDRTHRVTAYLTIRSGGYDSAGKPGVAHYLEHLVQNNVLGTEKYDRDGNASTTGDETTYFLSGPPADLDHLLARLVKVFEKPKLPEAFMRSERDIVEREYDLRMAEEPLTPVWESINHRLYGQRWHGRSVLGTKAEIRDLTIGDAMQFHKRTHVPANAWLLVAGNVTAEEARPMIEEHFGELAAGKPPAPLQPTPLRAGREKTFREVSGLAEPELVYAKRGTLPGAVAEAADNTPMSEHDMSENEMALRFDLLLDVFTSTLDGSLAKPLRYDDFIARRFDVYLYPIAPGAFEFDFSATPDRGVTLESLLDSFEGALASVAREGIPEQTFERIRERRVRDLQENDDDFDLQLNLAMDQLHDGLVPTSVAARIVQVKSVTTDDLKPVLQALLQKGATVATLVRPDSSADDTPNQ